MTKEDLMQIKQLLDEQKEEISELMDQKLDGQKQEIIELVDQKLNKQKHEIIQDCTANMNVLIESMIQPQFNLLAEGQADIQEKLIPRSRVDELEEEIKFMKIMYRQMAEDIAKLKKAQ